ncbi:MAG: hypothetical protein JNK38_28710 [Acidobacteria bacterium]|nr:hypothetical protein [Acidobacteriota bacterium]
METELNPIEQLWMSEQAVVMYAFGQLGTIIVVAGLVLALLLLAGATFLPDSENPKGASPSRGLTVKLKFLTAVIRQKPGFGQTVLRALALIACLVAAQA